jgi:hypothetical protein
MKRRLCSGATVCKAGNRKKPFRSLEGHRDRYRAIAQAADQDGVLRQSTPAWQPSTLASNVIKRMRASFASPARNAPYRELCAIGQSGCPAEPYFATARRMNSRATVRIGRARGGGEAIRNVYYFLSPAASGA